MKLVLYNTFTRKKELFKPLHTRWVGLYTCGPTVYNFVHIGNLRTYIFQDILKRTLTHAGYRVRHIMNLTDVDDKTVRGAHAAGKTLKIFTIEYERAFREDLKNLNIIPPERFTRATEHIPDMIRLISLLLRRGFAYEKEGSAYFDISRFKPYGKLAHLDRKGLKAGARVDVDEYQKNEAQDFVLWKAKKPGEPSWRAPFGEGRPGWHIECSAMSTKYLGQPLDLHTAGVDLIFPHHENEIAQSEAATGKQFVRYWLHGEHLSVDGRKMSKSLGNTFTLHDIRKRGISLFAFRYLVFTSHYRSKLNFTWKSLNSAEVSLKKLYDFSAKLSRDNYRGSTSLDTFEEKFSKALYDDLDMPGALAVVWMIIREYHKNPAHFNTKRLHLLLYTFDRILGFGLQKIRIDTVPPAIMQLVAEREKLRKERRWQEADKIRGEISAQGYALKDTAEGPHVEKQ